MSSLRLFLLFGLSVSMLLRADDRRQDFAFYMEGKSVYERNCLICHGLRGDGNGEMSQGLSPKPRSFREGMFKFRSTPFGKLPVDADLRRTIRGGLSGTGMGMFTQLSESEVTAVLEYVKSFSRRWNKPENHAAALTFPQPPDWFAQDEARQTHAQAGRLLYQNLCAACHGTKADGQGPAAPMLKDIWNLPSKPSDLRQPYLRCGDTPTDLFRLLTTGMNGTPMISYADVLTPSQRWEVIAYLATLKLPAVPTLGGAGK